MSLAPSYRTLFLNVDKAVDRDGYDQKQSQFLRTITLAGLPVDDVPCVEVWGRTGLLFTSHVGSRPSSACSWSDEYADGLYKVEKEVLGDFSVVCRFGGSLANSKDKSTLIFKYQNSTGEASCTSLKVFFVYYDVCLHYSAFLSTEICELHHSDVDINPQYSDSIDTAIFTMHLMFQHNRSECTQLLPPFPSLGVDSFTSGLDEVPRYLPIYVDLYGYFIF
jgi:hypothetical protein